MIPFLFMVKISPDIIYRLTLRVAFLASEDNNIIYNKWSVDLF